MAVREFTDSTNVEWRVWDVAPQHLHPITRAEDYLGNLQDGWLVFESESEKRRLPMSTPEFHEAASRIERIARQVFGIARAQREVGEALQSQHDESIDDEARERDAKDRASAVSGRERRR